MCNSVQPGKDDYGDGLERGGKKVSEACKVLDVREI